MKQFLILILSFFSLLVQAQCIVADLAHDLKGASEEFKNTLKTTVGFNERKTLNQSFDGFEAIKSLPYSLKQKIHNLNWDSSTLNNFNSDIGSSSALLDKFVENEGLLDTWDVVKDFSGGVSRDVDILKLINDNENLKNICNLYKNGHKSKLYSNLSEFDEVIINHYTKYSSDVRSIGGDFYSSYKSKLNDALEKLPESLNNSDLVYGGYNFSDELISQLTNGNFVEFGDFLYTSRLESVAEDFLKVKGGNVYVEIIDSYNGKLIESLSSLSYENEVLFASDALFKVKGTPVPIPHPNGIEGQTVLKVVLEQQ